ncbi:MAG: NYN domain-containing protein [Nanoarchaeota archaeon]
MKIIVFDDAANSIKSLERLNYRRPLSDKRDWKFSDFHKLILKKTQGLLKDRSNSFEVVRTYIYTGEYTQKVMGIFRKDCFNTIKDMDELIKNEVQLLQKVEGMGGANNLKLEIRQHVNTVKTKFEQIRQSKFDAMDNQAAQAEQQKDFFKKVRESKFERRTTPLVNREGYIRQKGVDVKLATDLIKFAHSNAYDVAILMSGDSDLTESIKLVREQLGKIIILFAYLSPAGSTKYNTINNDLIELGDFFINADEFTEEEIQEISDAKPADVPIVL